MTFNVEALTFYLVGATPGGRYDERTRFGRGLRATVEAVFTKLGEPLPLGYCNVGRVLAVGDRVTDFAVGDRVASNGHHAEFVCVPENLVAHIPENGSDEEATFTVVGAIGLQGMRLCEPTFGETIVVIGLGLIGLLTVELLVAHGCRVIGVDLDENKVNRAYSFDHKYFSCYNKSSFN